MTGGTVLGGLLKIAAAAAIAWAWQSGHLNDLLGRAAAAIGQGPSVQVGHLRDATGTSSSTTGATA